MTPFHSEDYYIKKLFAKRTIEQIMTDKVETINEKENFSKAAEMFVRNNSFYLPVVGEDNKLKGLLSQKYLYKTLSPKKMVDESVQPDENVVVDGNSVYDKKALDSFYLETIMKKDPLTLTPEDLVAKAIIYMKKNNLGCIPIVDGEGKFSGMLTTHDIVHYFAKLVEEDA